MSVVKIKSWLASLFVLALVGCGGGGGGSAGDPLLGGGTTTTPPSGVTGLVVTLSSATVANTGAETVTATVVALDANNNALRAVPVTLAADNNGVVTVLGDAGSVTDATGRMTATVGIGSDRTNRSIKLTGTSGSATGSATLSVVDSPTGVVPESIDVVAAATTVGTAGDGVRVSAFVRDSNNNALAAVPVSFRASTGTLSSISAVSDASGVATAILSSGANRANRESTVIVSAGAVRSELKLPITGTTLTLQGPTSIILGSTANFDLVATDSKGNVISGVTVTGVSSLGNTLTASSGGVTNSSGLVRFTYVANVGGTDTELIFSGAGATAAPPIPLQVSGLNFAFVSPGASTAVPVNTPQVVSVKLLVGGAPPAPTAISFASSGGALSAATAMTDAVTGIAQVSLTSSSAGPVTVQASVSVAGVVSTTTLPLSVVATVPASLVLQVSPTALAPNAAGSSANQAQVLAKVTDALGNPVQGQTVNFTRVVDPSGGNLQQVSAITDSSGKASVTYVSGPESTANNGVKLQGSVASNPAVTGQALLTVNQAALFIALGTGNVITNVDPQTYRKNWVVYVTDSNGIAVNAATLTIKAIPLDYRTGVHFLSGEDYVYQSPIYDCRNEDTNGNGILDSGEDDNKDGVLWPGNVIAVSPATVQTANGLATIALTYAESYAPWVRLRLTVSATVAGTESKTNAEFVVEGMASDFKKAGGPPAGFVSPFGVDPKSEALAISGACRLVF